MIHTLHKQHVIVYKQDERPTIIYRRSQCFLEKLTRHTISDDEGTRTTYIFNLVYENNETLILTANDIESFNLVWAKKMDVENAQRIMNT